MSRLRSAISNAINPPTVSLEARAPELEYVFFGRIKDFKELEAAASKEDQEQWEVRPAKIEGNKYFGNFRIRKTNADKYTLCMKILTDGTDVRDEIEVDADEDLFEATKKIATSGMVKCRYNFPVADSDLVWEVDVYFDTEGNMIDWCKIDLEVKKPIDKLPAYPIALDDLFDTQPAQRTPEQRAFVNKLMDDHFVLKNQYPKT